MNTKMQEFLNFLTEEYEGRTFYIDPNDIHVDTAEKAIFLLENAPERNMKNAWDLTAFSAVINNQQLHTENIKLASRIIDWYIKQQRELEYQQAHSSVPVSITGMVESLHALAHCCNANQAKFILNYRPVNNQEVHELITALIVLRERNIITSEQYSAKIDRIYPDV